MKRVENMLSINLCLLNCRNQFNKDICTIKRIVYHYGSKSYDIIG